MKFVPVEELSTCIRDVASCVRDSLLDRCEKNSSLKQVSMLDAFLQSHHAGPDAGLLDRTSPCLIKATTAYDFAYLSF